MSISIYAGLESWLIGTPELLTAFYSTVAVRLEDGLWGSRFPVVMHNLYAGTLTAEDCRAARAELAVINRELASLSAQSVIWDAERPSWRPTWVDDADDVERLPQSLVTSDGHYLAEVLTAAVATACEKGTTLEVG